MDKTAGAALLVIGVVALFAAIVGGGVKIREIEVGSLPSKWRQWLLAGFGVVVGFIGLMMVLPDSDNGNNTADTQNVAAPDANSEATNAIDTTDENVEANSADANAAETDTNESGVTDENATP
jgi:hypothetical protein